MKRMERRASFFGMEEPDKFSRSNNVTFVRNNCKKFVNLQEYKCQMPKFTVNLVSVDFARAVSPNDSGRTVKYRGVKKFV
jgi:hypothetical protein